VAKSIKNMEVIDLAAKAPELKISKKKDDAAVAENKQFEIEYKEKYGRHLDRETKLEEDMMKAYTTIITKYCTKVMRSRVEEHPDYTNRIDDDPIELMKTIKELSQESVRAQYPLTTMDYVKRQKQMTDVVKSQLGEGITKMMHSSIEKTKKYLVAKTSEKKTMLEESFEEWNAYLLVQGADKKKYGSLTAGFVTQFSLGNDQYPKNVNLAVDALSNHRFDQKYIEHKKKKQDQQRKQHQDKQRKNKSNDDESVSASSFAQRKEPRCFCCGEKGHVSPKCNKKGTTPREQWYVNRLIATQTETSEGNDAIDDNTSVTSDLTTDSQQRQGRGRDNRNNNQNNEEWNGFQAMSRQAMNGMQTEQSGSQAETRPMDTKFLLDTGSTLRATIKNQDLVTNVRKSKRPINMLTNAGSKVMDLDADVPGIGVGKFDPDQMANIFGFSHMADKHRITYDNAKEDAFLVHTKNGITRFSRDGRVYSYEPTDKYLAAIAKTKSMKPPKKTENDEANVYLQECDDNSQECSKEDNNDELEDETSSFWINSVSENRKRYTERQFEQAKRARRLYHAVGGPTVTNFKSMIRQNIIQDCPVTAKDVDVAEAIFGPDIGTLKGRTTRRTPKVVREDDIEVPKEITDKYDDLIHCMDIMYVNGMPMMTGIDKTIRYRGLIPLENRTADELYRGLDKFMRLYNGADHKVKEIRCDREFKVLMDDVKDDLDVNMEYPPTNDHVPEAERNNRVIGERIRATHHRLPFKSIPKVMTKYLAMTEVEKLNYFPAKGGVSEYYSPRMLMKKRNLNYKKDCAIPFGTYVQANRENKPTNDNRARTLDAIYLRPTLDRQAGHEVMNLATGKAITCARVWEIPITPIIIKAVETMAEKQGIKQLKLTTKDKQPLLPNDWVAGVEYDFDDEDSDEDDEDYDENENNDDIETAEEDRQEQNNNQHDLPSTNK